MDVSDMVVDLAGNNMADANNKFMTIMSDKINAALDAKKIELAQSFSSDEDIEIEDVENEEEEIEETEEEIEDDEAEGEEEDLDVLPDDEAEESEEEEVEDEDIQAVSDESN